MSRELLSYLDECHIQTAPEFEYLGHFRQHQYLDEGHNELRMEQQIESGNIPDIRGGTNTPADAEPGSFSGTNELTAGEAAGKAQSQGSQSMGSSGSGPASAALKSAFGIGESGGFASALGKHILAGL